MVKLNTEMLLKAVVDRSLEDLKHGYKFNDKKADKAMLFILSPLCETYCMYSGLEYETVRRDAACLYRELINSPGQG